MTSNQLAYWRTEEEKRANRAKEFETSRHNTQTESLTSAQQQLDKLGLAFKGQELKIRNAEALNDLNRLYAQYGNFAAESIPWDVRSKVLKDLGVEVTDTMNRADSDDETWFNAFWGEFRRFWNNFTSGIKSLGQGSGALF